MSRVAKKVLEKLTQFLDSLPTEARSKCTLCNETLTHIVKQAEAQTGAPMATVTRVIAEKHNETAAHWDKVGGNQLRNRVQQREGVKCSNRADNTTETQEILSNVESLVVDGAKTIKAANTHVGKNTGENEWYTPGVFIEDARTVMGCIDLDPASSDIANERVRRKEWLKVSKRQNNTTETQETQAVLARFVVDHEDSNSCLFLQVNFSTGNDIAAISHRFFHKLDIMAG